MFINRPWKARDCVVDDRAGGGVLISTSLFPEEACCDALFDDDHNELRLHKITARAKWNY